jgi:hypothetical protein
MPPAGLRIGITHQRGGPAGKQNLRLYLHIGTEKTGTTSFQKFMAVNRPFLGRQGLLYPETPGWDNHIALATVARRARSELWDELRIPDREGWEAFGRKFRERLSAELAEHPGRTVVMSGEHCSSRLRTDEDVHRLLEFLDGLFTQITIVVYLRRQDDFLSSTYSTDIKNGGTQPLGMPDDDAMAFRYDYWELLSRWARVFGRSNMLVGRYGTRFLVNGNLVDDFLTGIGVVLGPDLQRPHSANESLDAESLEFLRLTNAHLRPSEQRRAMVAALQALSRGALIDLPDAELSEFMARLAESNRRVALEYFGRDYARKGDPLFGERDGARERTPPITLSADRAVAIAAQLYLRLRPGGAKPLNAGSSRGAIRS